MASLLLARAAPLLAVFYVTVAASKALVVSLLLLSLLSGTVATSTLGVSGKKTANLAGLRGLLDVHQLHQERDSEHTPSLSILLSRSVEGVAPNLRFQSVQAGFC